METIKQTINDTVVTINVVESTSDLDGFRDFIRANTAWLGCDSETTGLDIYGSSFRCRTVQFGNLDEAWVIPVERGMEYASDVVKALRAVNKLILHNASYDLQVFDRCLGVEMERLWPKVLDTRILAHLADPRGKNEGGIGTSLEDLTREYVSAELADGVKTLMTDLAKSVGVTKAQVWEMVEYEHPDYRRYAGMDPVLAAHLAKALAKLVPAESKRLIRYEHKLAAVCAAMERTGFLLDVEYTTDLSDKLREAEADAANQAWVMGCENVFSTDQVADVLESRGVTGFDKTPTGKRRVDKTLLESLVESGDPFAKAVYDAKRARKWRTTWVDGFLSRMDPDGRCHAAINPLRARTARMSITGIPAQTLPASDSLVRRCFVADRGQLICSVDYQAQELRVLAALSGDPTMKHAFKTGADLHQITADASGVSRKVGKMVNFAYVYGSGPRNIAQQAGVTVETAREVIAGFERSYPLVKQLSRDVQRTARRDGYIVTEYGRRLPVDEGREYAALNYLIQSTSRDVTAEGLLRLDKAGLTPYLRLPIHDEVLLSLPETKARNGAKLVADLMKTRFNGVLIDTDSEVGKRSWGSLYGADS